MGFKIIYRANIHTNTNRDKVTAIYAQPYYVVDTDKDTTT